MKLVFFDESGYSKSWLEDMDKQPFHVLAGFLVDANDYVNSCEALRTEVQNINLDKLPYPLGLGFEIKAQEIAKGSGWWKSHNDERNRLRELMLSFPTSSSGVGFLVVIDKLAHAKKYNNPEPPHKIAFQFIFERLQWYLIECKEHAVCIYDQTKFLDDDLHKASMGLMRDGSSLTYWSDFYQGQVNSKFQIDRIKEFYLGLSENSLGIQVADYLSTFGYQYFKGGCPQDCGWWETLSNSLYKKNGKADSFGLKVFP